jgi:hypothetical protein
LKKPSSQERLVIWLAGWARGLAGWLSPQTATLAKRSDGAGAFQLENRSTILEFFQIVTTEY